MSACARLRRGPHKRKVGSTAGRKPKIVSLAGRIECTSSGVGEGRRFFTPTFAPEIEIPRTHDRDEAMAAVAEKARFYLERAVPLLRELEEREIFTKVSSVPAPPAQPPTSGPN